MIDLINISIQFGGKYLFKDFNYKIHSNDRICLVGANGSGKSTLLKIINGEVVLESGEIHKQKRISVGYLPQDNVIHKSKSLLEEANSALTDITSMKEKESSILTQMKMQELDDDDREELVYQLGDVHNRLEELDYYSSSARVEKILKGLGFSEDDFEKMTDTFSLGWQMRIALSKILISQNDILLMDEPTNHLDLDSLQWLIGFLNNTKCALIIVSHDKYFVNSVTNRTLEIFLNKITNFKGNYDAYLSFKEERNELLESQYELQQKKIKETEKFIERFRYKATKAKQVQSRIKQLEKVELLELPSNKKEIKIRFPEAPQSGKVNIELKGISKSFDDNVIFDMLDFTINRKDKIAFVGPNGAGKTTLSKIIAGIIPFDSGERIIGHNTLIAHYAQDVADQLNPDLDILETLMGISDKISIGGLRNLLGSFLFTGDDVFKKVGVLSGGEKSRVALAKILLTSSNLIILDEPTNHLDITSKEILQKALIDFSGSIVLISHDIDFLKPIVNKTVEIKNKTVSLFEGGIEYFLYKKSLNENSMSADDNESNKTSFENKKLQKKREAERRQKIYSSTKGLKEKIKLIEKKIEGLEKNQKELEDILFSAETYKDIKFANEKTLELNQNKSELEQCLVEWEKLSVEIQKIEESFS
jgi:ATP-binding cassette, subfamily F, member 3